MSSRKALKASSTLTGLHSGSSRKSLAVGHSMLSLPDPEQLPVSLVLVLLTEGLLSRQAPRA